MKVVAVMLFGIMLSLLTITSCSSDGPEDPIIPNEEEVITTLSLTLMPNGGGSDIVFRFQDLDGDGGNSPILTGGTLAANTTYTGFVTLQNELESPAEDITVEVAAEAEDHQFFYQSSISDLGIAYDDADANGHPIGLQIKMTTGMATTGMLTIILRHEPNKDATGVSDGDITNAGGETDIEITFDIDVQ